MSTPTYSIRMHAHARPSRAGIYLDVGRGLDMLVEHGRRGGCRYYWRRSDRRESADMLVSTWDRTQRDALAR
jgi:hypothetical protein